MKNGSHFDDNKWEAIINKLAKQEERMFLKFREISNQWNNGLLIFSGLAISSLSNKADAYADCIIVLWLLEALFILVIIGLNLSVSNLELNIHFEGTVLDEHEKKDSRSYERICALKKLFEIIIFFVFVLSTILTMIYFLR